MNKNLPPSEGTYCHRWGKLCPNVNWGIFHDGFDTILSDVFRDNQGSGRLFDGEYRCHPWGQSFIKMQVKVLKHFRIIKVLEMLHPKPIISLSFTDYRGLNLLNLGLTNLLRAHYSIIQSINCWIISTCSRFPPIPSSSSVTLYWIRTNMAGSDNAAIQDTALDSDYT